MYYITISVVFINAPLDSKFDGSNLFWLYFVWKRLIQPYRFVLLGQFGPAFGCRDMNMLFFNWFTLYFSRSCSCSSYPRRLEKEEEAVAGIWGNKSTLNRSIDINPNPRIQWLPQIQQCPLILRFSIKVTNSKTAADSTMIRLKSVSWLSLTEFTVLNNFNWFQFFIKFGRNAK